MRAVQLAEPGAGLDGLRVEQVPRPEPGPGEVLVRVHTVGANHLDHGAMLGRFPAGRLPVPLRVGIDPAGEVAEVGIGVGTDRVGTRVVVKPNVPCGQCGWCADGMDAECPRQRIVGVHLPGGAADLVVVPERNAAPIPERMPYWMATAAVHAVPVALRLIRSAGGVRPGERVLVTGASGAVGSALVWILRHLGAQPLPVVRTRRGRGSHHPVPAVTYAELPSALAEHAPGGVAAAFDTTGAAPAIEAAWTALGWAGALVVCSALPGAELRVGLRELYLRRNRLIGSASAGFAEVTEGLAMVADGIVPITQGPRFGLDQAARAYAALSDVDRIGKVIMHVGD